MTALYKLDDNDRPVLACTRMLDRDGLLDWCAWMAKAEAQGRLRIARDTVGTPDHPAEVSTVFLGVAVVPYGAAKLPLLFETALFRGGDCTVLGRKATIEQARAYHKSAVETFSIIRGSGLEGKQDASSD